MARLALSANHRFGQQFKDSGPIQIRKASELAANCGRGRKRFLANRGSGEIAPAFGHHFEGDGPWVSALAENRQLPEGFYHRGVMHLECRN